jgi:hypothetical protein
MSEKGEEWLYQRATMARRMAERKRAKEKKKFELIQREEEKTGLTNGRGLIMVQRVVAFAVGAWVVDWL